MPKTLIFTKLDGEADRILDALSERAGLPCRDSGERRILELEGAVRDADARRALRASGRARRAAGDRPRVAGARAPGEPLIASVPRRYVGPSNTCARRVVPRATRTR